MIIPEFSFILITLKLTSFGIIFICDLRQVSEMAYINLISVKGTTTSINKCLINECYNDKRVLIKLFMSDVSSVKSNDILDSYKTIIDTHILIIYGVLYHLFIFYVFVYVIVLFCHTMN